MAALLASHQSREAYKATFGALHRNSSPLFSVILRVHISKFVQSDKTFASKIVRSKDSYGFLLTLFRPRRKLKIPADVFYRRAMAGAARWDSFRAGGSGHSAVSSKSDGNLDHS